MSVTQLGLREGKIDFWLSKQNNILLIGTEGVGKTQMFREGMLRTGLSFDTNVAQWSTPLLDFVGCDPTTADALYFDALQNDPVAQAAVKEILSLRRWRGKAVKESAVVWGAYTIKTSDEHASDGLAETFDCAILVPSSPLHGYFERKFGKALATAALTWWGNLGKDEALQVSPRRLEAALKMWCAKGDIRDVLPVSSNVRKLYEALNEVNKL